MDTCSFKYTDTQLQHLNGLSDYHRCRSSDRPVHYRGPLDLSGRHIPETGNLIKSLLCTEGVKVASG